MAARILYGAESFSSYPPIRMTIKSDNAVELDSCMQQVQAVKENHQTIDIRGIGTFALNWLLIHL